MEETLNENAKISDSGYSNTCSNSQSHRSSDSLTSRNSNRSTSSGYEGENFSTFESRNEAPPQPISKRKEKEHKKKKLKAAAVSNIVTDVAIKSVGPTAETPSFNVVIPTKPILEKKTEEVATVELVDATDPSEHNDETITDAEAGRASPTNPLDDSISQANEGFCVVISMHDGLVLYTTTSICAALGFPRDSWIGHSFIDYVHPKDKITLIDQISRGVALPEEDRPKGLNGRRSSLFCDLRKNTKFGECLRFDRQRERRTNFYLPFHLILTFRDFSDRTTDQSKRAMFLVITAQPVHSAYKVPEETIISSIFTTRHTATCNLSHVDPDVVQYFGYLPQDMVGRSLFDFYHPEDLPFIKDIYETVMRYEGSSFRSKPYRFAVQNGGYVVLDTEWSSFINPWTKKLEFVVGQHRVLKGPADPDVFKAPSTEPTSNSLMGISEEVLKESKIIEGEIRTLLNESIQRSFDIGENDVLTRCKDLASFMENLLQEVRGPCAGKNPLIGDERSFSEHDSVMLGEISPHHEYYDSKSSTETPPSYNQLNYNENIERFFKSKPPVATMYGSNEEIANGNDDEDKNIPASGARKCMSPINGSGESGSVSAENLIASSGSNNQTSTANRGDGCHINNNGAMATGFKPPTLTASLLSRHNEDMERLMMQKHRELRSSIKNSDKLKDSRIKPPLEKMVIDENVEYVVQGHGVKRCGSHSWKGHNFKVSKHDEIPRATVAGHVNANIGTTVTSANADHTSTIPHTNANINLWPPISVAVPSMPPPPAQPCASSTFNTANIQVMPRIPVLPPVIPIYYVPVSQDRNSAEMASGSQETRDPPLTSQPTAQNPYISYITTAMAGLIYPPVIAGPPPGTMMYRPFLILEQTASPKERPSVNKSSEQKRPASQATSIKVAPDSVMARSESSKKVMSPREMFSSCLSNDDEGSSLLEVSTQRNTYRRRQTDYNGDESSSSSFYSSFLNRSSECSCNPDQRTAEQPIDDQDKQQQQGKRRKQPPWLEGVQLTPELIYEYQIHPKTLNEVLQADMETLKKLDQPLLVNDQLGQLYLDLELEGFGTKLLLEEGITSSGSDSGSSNDSWPGVASQYKHGRKMAKYGKLLMIHEENGPFSPPPPPPPPAASTPSSVPSSSTSQNVFCQQS